MKEKKKAKAGAVVPASDYRQQVSDQYRAVCAKTGEFFREVVRFGALLNEVADFVGESRGRDHDGEGLKGWLEENCPEVNYNTAMGYKMMADKCARMIGGGSQAIAALQGRERVHNPGTGEMVPVDAAFIGRRDELFEKADSRRKVEQLWFEFCAKERNSKCGRPKAAGGQLPKLSKSEEAKSIWNVLLQGVSRASVRDAIPLLPEKETKVAYDTLRGLCELLKSHVRSF